MTGTSGDRSWLSEAELLSSAPKVTSRQLRRWREFGLLAPPERHYPGPSGGGGSSSWYPPSTRRSVRVIARAMGRGRGRWQDAALQLFAEGLWLDDDCLRSALWWLAEGVSSAVRGASAPIAVHQDLAQDDGWERAHALSESILNARPDPVRQMRDRVRAHLRATNDKESVEAHLQTVLTAVFSPAFGSVPELQIDDFDDVAVAMGVLEPGAEQSAADRASVEEALRPRARLDELPTVAAEAPIGVVLERRDLVRETIEQLRRALSAGLDVGPGVEELLGALAQPHAFATFVLQSVASKPTVDAAFSDLRS